MPGDIIYDIATLQSEGPIISFEVTFVYRQNVTVYHELRVLHNTLTDLIRIPISHADVNELCFHQVGSTFDHSQSVLNSQGFIKGQAVGKLTGCEANFSRLVCTSEGKLF